MKNILPIAAVIGAGYFVINYFKRKRAAGQNLKFELLKVTIDTQRTLQTGFYKLFYDITLNIINSENAAVNIKNVNLNVFLNGKNIGTLEQTINFSVPRESTKQIMFKASFITLGLLSYIMDIIQNGFSMNFNVKGFIDTDLGRVNVDFSKNVGGNINGNSKKKKNC